MEENFEQEPKKKELFSEEVFEDDLELDEDLEDLPI
jgi:hypothetical protein